MDSHHQHHQHGQTHARERMFEKHLTPSDVGKLNRLVIPKQHAERHFPLDSESGEKGLLLSFEDETRKAWTFRYSYWTSSQSYVLTKGWSRYVKEKKLDAGDAVLFERYRPGPRGGDDRLYIGCRRRRSSDAGGNATAAAACRGNAVVPETSWSPYAAAPCFYMINSVNGGGAAAETPTGNTRRLRLFGVNLECGTEQPEPENLAPPPWSQFMPTNASTPQL